MSETDKAAALRQALHKVYGSCPVCIARLELDDKEISQILQLMEKAVVEVLPKEYSSKDIKYDLTRDYANGNNHAVIEAKANIHQLFATSATGGDDK